MSDPYGGLSREDFEEMRQARLEQLEQQHQNACIAFGHALAEVCEQYRDAVCGGKDNVYFVGAKLLVEQYKDFIHAEGQGICISTMPASALIEALPVVQTTE